jgi:hypothetical protein
MTFYISGNCYSTEGTQRIGFTSELVNLAMREALGDQTIAGDESLRRRIEVLTDIVANLVDRIAKDDEDKLELVGLSGYDVTPTP